MLWVMGEERILFQGMLTKDKGQGRCDDEGEDICISEALSLHYLRV